MQEKPYPFRGKFLKTSIFRLLLQLFQKNTVSLRLKKASELSFYSSNRGIDFVDTPDVRKKTQAFFSLTEPGH